MCVYDYIVSVVWVFCLPEMTVGLYNWYTQNEYDERERVREGINTDVIGTEKKGDKVVRSGSEQIKAAQGMFSICEFTYLWRL